MPMVLKCLSPTCGESFTVPEGSTGKPVRCKRCLFRFIAGEEASLLQRRVEGRIDPDQRPGDAHADRAGLPVAAAPVFDVELEHPRKDLPVGFNRLPELSRVLQCPAE